MKYNILYKVLAVTLQNIDKKSNLKRIKQALKKCVRVNFENPANAETDQNIKYHLNLLKRLKKKNIHTFRDRPRIFL